MVLGRGADLTALDSAEAEQALALWTDWVSKGLAPNSVLSNTQGTSWDEFMTGEYAFAENGSWFKSAADEAGYKSIQVPGFDGGVAPAPTGGEFITIPIQKDTSRYETSAKIVDCLSTGDTGATALGYVAPTADGQPHSWPQTRRWSSGSTPSEMPSRAPPTTSVSLTASSLSSSTPLFRTPSAARRHLPTR